MSYLEAAHKLSLSRRGEENKRAKWGENKNRGQSLKNPRICVAWNWSHGTSCASSRCFWDQAPVSMAGPKQFAELFDWIWICLFFFLSEKRWKQLPCMAQSTALRISTSDGISPHLIILLFPWYTSLLITLLDSCSCFESVFPGLLSVMIRC